MPFGRGWKRLPLCIYHKRKTDPGARILSEPEEIPRDLSGRRPSSGQ